MALGYNYPPHLSALIASKALLAKAYQVVGVDLKPELKEKHLKALVKYYFNLKPPADDAKINALANAINFLAEEGNLSEERMAEIEANLNKNFNAEGELHFNDFMAVAEGNLKTKRPLPLPSVEAPPLPPLPEKKESSVAASSEEILERPAMPTRVPRPAQFTSDQDKILKAVEKIKVDPNFTTDMAKAYIQSQRQTEKVANRGYEKAAGHLGIQQVLKDIEKLSTKAIKKGDVDQLKGTMGFITEVLEQVRAKKGDFEKLREKSEIMNFRATAAQGVLARSVGKLQNISEKCNNALPSAGHAPKVQRG